MFAVLHFMSDEEDPHRLVADYRNATVPGSCLAVSHVTTDSRPEVEDVLAVLALASQVTNGPVRGDPAVRRYDLVSPVWCSPEWRPEIELEYSAPSPIYGGVGLRI